MLKKLTEKKGSPFSQLKIFLFLAIISLSFILVFDMENYHRLIIENQQSKERYLTVNVSPGDKLTFGWIHSLEKIPWTEEYLILEDNDLLLEKITIPAFGAGIPHNRGKVTRIENGIIIMEKIDEVFEEINWIHSQSAAEYIKVNEGIIVKGADLPHHQPMKLRIEKGMKICLRFPWKQK